MESRNDQRDLVVLAQEVAAAAHRAQVDKAGHDYIDHPRRVAAKAEALAEKAGMPSEAIDMATAAAWLHDVVEDTETGETKLREDFPTEIVDAVMAVTKRSGESPETYFSRVRGNRIAGIVKTADLADNTDPARQALLDEDTRARLRKKYRRAYELLGVAPEPHD
ncbi:HD domain-containing protein [Brevibacterium marinum]|uniref:(P)ppGpp synthase/HD superfamily hydrolase n=1 Tax=Brevibacterium marinum TaxID=418643 RepID=A0A846SAT6_9MICO|nr:HD domain-containing protein [Brevibacterium marinum]NJC58402.1 (p)ppGpp synthase/HD superfamily hydrolase [Brevibacterium marinum]